jgi:hypothetical protein
VPGAQELGQAERPDLLRRITRGQQAGQVAALRSRGVMTKPKW